MARRAAFRNEFLFTHDHIFKPGKTELSTGMSVFVFQCDVSTLEKHDNLPYSIPTKSGMKPLHSLIQLCRFTGVYPVWWNSPNSPPNNLQTPRFSRLTLPVSTCPSKCFCKTSLRSVSNPEIPWVLPVPVPTVRLYPPKCGFRCYGIWARMI